MSFHKTLQMLRDRRTGRLDEQDIEPTPEIEIPDNEVVIVKDPNPVSGMMQVRTSRGGVVDTASDMTQAMVVAKSARDRLGITGPIKTLEPDGSTEVVEEGITGRDGFRNVTGAMADLQNRDTAWTVERDGNAVVGVFEEELNADRFVERMARLGVKVTKHYHVGERAALAMSAKTLGFLIADDKTYRFFGPKDLKEARLTGREIDLWVSNDEPLYRMQQAAIHRLEKLARTGRLTRRAVEDEFREVATTASSTIASRVGDRENPQAIEDAVDIMSDEFLDSNPAFFEAIDEQTDAIKKTAEALMNGEDSIETARGRKSTKGILDMIKNASPQQVADALLAGDTTLDTEFGRKSKEGIVDMIKRAKEGGETARRPDQSKTSTMDPEEGGDQKEEAVVDMPPEMEMSPGEFLDRLEMQLQDKGLPDAASAVNNFGLERISKMRRDGVSPADAADAVIDDRNAAVSEVSLFRGSAKKKAAEMKGPFAKAIAGGNFKRAADMVMSANNEVSNSARTAMMKIFGRGVSVGDLRSMATEGIEEGVTFGVSKMPGFEGRKIATVTVDSSTEGGIAKGEKEVEKLVNDGWVHIDTQPGLFRSVSSYMAPEQKESIEESTTLSGKSAQEIADMAATRSENVQTAIRRLSFLKGLKVGEPTFEKALGGAIKILSRRTEQGKEIELDDTVQLDEGILGIVKRIGEEPTKGIEVARAVLSCIRDPQNGSKLMVPEGKYRAQLDGSRGVWVFSEGHADVNRALVAREDVYWIRIDSLKESGATGAMGEIIEIAIKMFDDPFVSEAVAELKKLPSFGA